MSPVYRVDDGGAILGTRYGALRCSLGRGTTLADIEPADAEALVSNPACGDVMHL